MSVADNVVEALEEYAAELELGERIMVTVVEKCSCNPAGTNPEKRALPFSGRAQCHVCNDRGWNFTTKTYLPPLETDVSER